jgi:hypothetical protein
VFAGWCAQRGVQAIPAAPATVAAFLASEADRGFRPVTVARRAAAITAAHRAQDHPNPCDSGAVQQVLSGIRRRHGTAPERRAAPLDLGPFEQVLAELDTSILAGLRDRALLLLGFGLPVVMEQERTLTNAREWDGLNLNRVRALDVAEALRSGLA